MVKLPVAETRAWNSFQVALWLEVYAEAAKQIQIGWPAAAMRSRSRYLWSGSRKMPFPTRVHVLFSTTQVMRYDFS